MIKLRSLLNELYINGFTVSDEKSGFHQPENFDKVQEGSGWVMMVGANDWEVGHTGCAVYFSEPSQITRVWMNIKYPSHLKVDDESEDNIKEVKSWGEKAWKTWVKVARSIHSHSSKDTISKRWPECFIDAIKTKEMTPFIKSWGVDSTTWKAMKKTND